MATFIGIVLFLLLIGLPILFWNGTEPSIKVKPLTKEEKEKARIKEKNRKAIARSKGRGWNPEP